jgi:hypothetical protein
MKRSFGTPSPAYVISLIALFVALGGTTYAATSLPKGSVGTPQLKKGAVTKTKINQKTLSALKGQRGAQGATGATGAAGQPGPPGPKGDTGSAGTNGTNGTNGVSVTSATLAQGNANCASGGSSFTAVNGTTYACNGAPATRLFAQINADASVNTSSSQVTTDHLATGDYLVNFGRDITHCVAIADEGELPVFSTPGGSSGSNLGLALIIISGAGSNVVTGFPTADTVRVITHNGTTQADNPFYLAVFC